MTAEACVKKGCNKDRLEHRKGLCHRHWNEYYQTRQRASRKAMQTQIANGYCRPKNVQDFAFAIRTAACYYVKIAKRYGYLPYLRGDAIRCVDCGAPARQYDHRDYAKPLDVQPVCVGCNARRRLGRMPLKRRTFK